MKTKILFTAFIVFVSFVLGLASGGYLFSDTQPRSIFSIKNCRANCFKANELAGLLSSIGIVKLGAPLPRTVYETDKIIVVEHPAPTTSFHQVIIPKKDIKDVSQIGPDDMDYIADVFAYIAKAIKQNDLTKYKVVTNGPDYQYVTYLHFHLIGGEALK